MYTCTHFIIKFQINMMHATRRSENGEKNTSTQFSSFTGAANLKNNQKSFKTPFDWKINALRCTGVCVCVVKKNKKFYIGKLL